MSERFRRKEYSSTEEKEVPGWSSTLNPNCGSGLVSWVVALSRDPNGVISMMVCGVQAEQLGESAPDKGEMFEENKGKNHQPGAGDPPGFLLTT